ncbi:MAG: hypothetical protein AAGC63_04400 [Propionicimonas sp.]|nr:hypothetical protein [Propionicimonas sp.]
MTAAEDIAHLADSARRLGIAVDEREIADWLSAIADEDAEEVVSDVGSGTFGHRASMLDFSPRDLERFRRIGAIVELTGPAGTTDAALALSGSAAQSKIQSYPGDCDYFERYNIRAATREEACAVLASTMREKVFAFHRGSTYQFLEAKLGSVPADGWHDGQPVTAGSPMTWTIEDVRRGHWDLVDADGETTSVAWKDAALDPGWVKLDWVVTDPARRQLSNASNVVDVTWEAPDGSITPLDGYLDAYFQEVYLDADDLPAFTRIVDNVSEDALDNYVEQLEAEVAKYLTKHLNYGKAAKRMYNVFRLSGRYLDAAFVRELFDQPTTLLYQVWSLIGTLDNAAQPGSGIPWSAVVEQSNQLFLEVVMTMDGDDEVEIVSALLELRQALEEQETGEARSAAVEGARTRVINVVNTFFRDKLTSRPTIKDYIDDIQGADHPVT